MSEEIIIDGVNVAECCCYENSKCLWAKRYYENNIVPVCEKVKDCYYKQLSRLQGKYDTLTNKFFNSETDKTRLQAENEELKHKNEILLGQLVINDGEDVTVQISQSQFEKYSRLKQENEELKALCDTYFTCYRAKHNDIEGNLFSYRKALEEIQKMFSEPCIEGENCFTCNSNCLNKDVLNIISEVLDERN